MTRSRRLVVGATGVHAGHPLELYPRRRPGAVELPDACGGRGPCAAASSPAARWWFVIGTHGAIRAVVTRSPRPKGGPVLTTWCSRRGRRRQASRCRSETGSTHVDREEARSPRFGTRPSTAGCRRPHRRGGTRGGSTDGGPRSAARGPRADPRCSADAAHQMDPVGSGRTAASQGDHRASHAGAARSSVRADRSKTHSPTTKSGRTAGEEGIVMRTQRRRREVHGARRGAARPDGLRADEDVFGDGELEGWPRLQASRGFDPATLKRAARRSA